jgi:hypothetical protein
LILQPHTFPKFVIHVNLIPYSTVHAFGGIRDVTPWLDSRNERNLQQDWHSAPFPVRTAVILVAVIWTMIAAFETKTANSED